METEFKINIPDSNIEIVNLGYKDGLTPTSKEPIFYVGILAKIKTYSQTYRRQTEVFVTFWTTIGPNTKSLTFSKNLIPSYKTQSKINSFKKKFPKKDLNVVVDATGINIEEFFNAYHSYLIITDWYSDSTKGNNF